MTRRFLFLACFSVAGSPALAGAQPVSPQFQVNTYTTDDQREPSIAADADGNFVVVWPDFGQDRMSGQRYESGGKPLGEEFEVVASGIQPAVASDSSGNFVVVWMTCCGDPNDGNGFGIFGRRFDKDGIPLGSEFAVNTYTTASQEDPSVAADANGNFVVVWKGRGSGDPSGIFGQRYDHDGNRLGGEFQVNTETYDVQYAPSVASDSQGNFVVVWQSNECASSGCSYPFRISGQRYDGDGNARGTEFVVATDGDPAHPSVASNANGDFVVVWDAEGVDGDGDYAVLGQRYDREGQLLEEFHVNTYTIHRQWFPSVSSDKDGNFVVVWESLGQENNNVEGGILGQRFDSVGRRLGREFHVNTYTTGHQSEPAVASDASGNFVVVWTDGAYLHQDGLDGSGQGIFGRAYAAPCEKGPSWQGSPCLGP